ncbi:hypothetical protein DEU56DRAFT_587768 [Suillus clintonianus]|uniref:uncharacterized protein n=1 Tax=Suillus clintonianus TaxID=1904413 RepID=UPI001B87C626|nr:uncharacterized protein DEU56DRAFT_587768 [Suillus clintonianus]KAG2125062.1 hypothetical protein DEU56DRAFT_587768 [Suillus clintonianus]
MGLEALDPTPTTTEYPSATDIVYQMAESLVNGGTDDPSQESSSPGSSHRSLTRSISGSGSRQAAYRTHKGPVHSRPVNTHRSIVDIHHGSPKDDPPIAPMVAAEVGRYKMSTPRDFNVPRITIPAMTTAFPADDIVMPSEWTMFVHPDGARYFVNQERRTFTEMNICNPEICDDIEYYMHYLLHVLQQIIESGNIVLDIKEVDLVIEPKVFDGGSVGCCYYFANHLGRCLFWLHDFNPEIIISEHKAVESLSHIRLAIQAQYWKHWDYFPNLCPITQYLVDELKDMLIHATCDPSTPESMFDGLREQISVVDRIKVYPLVSADLPRYHIAIVIGRTMYAFSQNYFVNYIMPLLPTWQGVANLPEMPFLQVSHYVLLINFMIAYSIFRARDATGPR